MDIKETIQLNTEGQPVESTETEKSFIRTMRKDMEILGGGGSVGQPKAPPPAKLPVAQPKPVTPPQPSIPSRLAILSKGVTPTRPSGPPKSVTPPEPEPALSTKEKVKLLIKENRLKFALIGLVIILIIGGLGGFIYWWFYLRSVSPPPLATHYQCQNYQCIKFEGEGIDQCLTDEDCQPAEPLEPIIPESLIPVNETETIELAIGQEDLILDRLKLVALQEQAASTLKRILVKLVSQTEKEYADLDTLILALGISLPNNILSAVTKSDPGAGNYTLFFYSQAEGNRLGIVMAMEKDSLDLLLKLWEENMEVDLNSFLLRKLVPLTATEGFQDNLYRGVAIRYINFPKPDLSIDYALINDNLVITASRESMYAIIDALLIEPSTKEPLVDKEVEEINDEQAQEILDVFSEGNNYYDELVKQNDSAAIQKTVDWFKAQESVGDAKGVPGAIWVKFKAGVKEMVIYTYRE